MDEYGKNINKDECGVVQRCVTPAVTCSRDQLTTMRHLEKIYDHSDSARNYIRNTFMPVWTISPDPHHEWLLMTTAWDVDDDMCSEQYAQVRQLLIYRPTMTIVSTWWCEHSSHRAYVLPKRGTLLKFANMWYSALRLPLLLFESSTESDDYKIVDCGDHEVMKDRKIIISEWINGVRRVTYREEKKMVEEQVLLSQIRRQSYVDELARITGLVNVVVSLVFDYVTMDITDVIDQKY